MALTLQQLITPRTKEQLLAQMIQALKGVGFVSYSGTGSGKVVASGLAKGNFSVVIRITTTGEPGTTAQYQVSTDGGVTWSAAATVPAVLTAIGATGASVLFSAGAAGAGDSFVAGDTATFYVATPTFNQTAWQQFSWQRRMLELDSEADADLDEFAATLAAAGFGQTAVDLQGGWLDIYCQNAYDERRNEAVQTQGVVVLTDAGSGGPYTIAAGSLWVSNTDGSLRYSNLTGGTLAEDGTLALAFGAETPGAAYNLGNGAVETMVTPLPGVTAANAEIVGAVTSNRAGAPTVTVAETTPGSLTVDCQAQIVITTGGALGAGIFKYSLDGGDTWDATGLTLPGGGTYVLGATGLTVTFASGTYDLADAFSFDAQLSWITQAGVDRESNSAYWARCQLKWSTLSAMPAGGAFQFWALAASTEVNRAEAYADSTVPGQVNVFLAGPLGAVTSDVVDAVDAYIKPRVPICATCVVASVVDHEIALTGTVYVTAGQRVAAQAAAEAALAEYAAAVPVGGVDIGTGTKIVSREMLIACILRGSPAHPVSGVQDCSLTAPSADVALAATEAPTITTTGLTWVEV